MYYLIRYNDNWADEMEMDGFAVMTKSEWQNYRDTVKLAFDRIQKNPKEFFGDHNDKGVLWIGFGTNEHNEYLTIEDFLNCFKLTELTSDEAEVFKRHFTHSHRDMPMYGQFPELEQFDNYLDEEFIDDIENS